MTNLEKLQKKYPSEAEIVILRKKQDYNSAIAHMRTCDAQRPFDQAKYDEWMQYAAKLYEDIKAVYVARGKTMPAHAATKGFDI